MFITKTMNESAEIDIHQFDLVDSICDGESKTIPF